MRPNLFDYATNELSQDAFLAWFFQWAHADCKKINPHLHETAREFMLRLIKAEHSIPDNYQISKLYVGTQWEKIDIWAEINEEYVVCIEDKTNTEEHSDQLKRYKGNAEKYYENTQFKKPVFVYLKTGNESMALSCQTKKKGYTVINRQEILAVLNKRIVSNDIFNDFKEHLQKIENQTNACEYTKLITSDWWAAAGFYLKLEKSLKKEIKKDQQAQHQLVPWKSSSHRGVFLGFWYCYRNISPTRKIYVQIANYLNNDEEEQGIEVAIKIDGTKPTPTTTLRSFFVELEKVAVKNKLKVRPTRFSSGLHSTVAIVEDPYQTDSNGKFNFDNFLKTLKQVEKTIDEFSRSKMQKS